MSNQLITPFLWFDNNAEEAVDFYIAIFPNSRITAVSRYGEAGPGPRGQVMVASFELNGQPFTALNGGPVFRFTEAISFYIHCKDQQEVDYYWEKLLAGGGQESQCGWLKDKFGLSWQVVPEALPKLLSDKNAAKAGNAMKAMLGMKKLIVKELQDAFDKG